MLETHIKVLASIYTALLMTALVSILLFGGFKFKSPSVKGKVIEAVMIDISQLKLKPRTKPQDKKLPPIKKEEKKVVPIKKDIPKDPPKKAPPKKDPPKKDPPRIVKKEPKVDVKAQELERKKRQERLKKLEEIRKKRIAAEKRRKKEQQNLKNLAQKTQKVLDKKTPVKNIGTKRGQSAADKINQLMTQYQLAVISSVERQWNKPTSANNNLLCYVKVRQIPGGGVIDATISTPCNANSIVRKSIIAAIQKADPLPYKGFEKVFSRTATFIFQPQD